MKHEDLKARMLDIEYIIASHDMIMLQGMIKGDSTSMLDTRNTIGRQGGEIPKLYRALIGLQGFRKQNSGNRKLFTEYISIVSANMISDVSKLDEILTFAITKKSKFSLIYVVKSGK